MFTFLDLLIVVGMALVAGSLVSVLLMFLIRNKTVQRVCFYIAEALSLYVGYVGICINGCEFLGQTGLAGMLILVSLASLVLSLVKKDNEKLFLAARIATAASLVIGVANALLI